MFGAEGVGWRGLGRDAAPAVVVAAAATATLWGALPAAKNPGHPHTAQAGGAEGASPSPGAGRPGVGGWRDRGPFGGLKGGNTSARVCWGARFQPLRGLAFFVAEPRTEDGSCWGEPSSPSEALLARDRGGWPGPPGYPSVWSPRAWLFPPGRRGSAGLSGSLSHWHLGQGLGLTSQPPGGPGVKNRGIVVTRPTLCNCRLPPGG